ACLVKWIRLSCSRCATVTCDDGTCLLAHGRVGPHSHLLPELQMPCDTRHTDDDIRSGATANSPAVRALAPCLWGTPDYNLCLLSARLLTVIAIALSFAGLFARSDYRSGSGMNSVSPGTGLNRPLFQSSLACSIRSRRDETKFHQIYRGPSSAAPPRNIRRASL